MRVAGNINPIHPEYLKFIKTVWEKGESVYMDAQLKYMSQKYEAAVSKISLQHYNVYRVYGLLVYYLR